MPASSGKLIALFEVSAVVPRTLVKPLLAVASLSVSWPAVGEAVSVPSAMLAANVFAAVARLYGYSLCLVN